MKTFFTAVASFTLLTLCLASPNALAETPTSTEKASSLPPEKLSLKQRAAKLHERFRYVRIAQETEAIAEWNALLELTTGSLRDSVQLGRSATYERLGKLQKAREDCLTILLRNNENSDEQKEAFERFFRVQAILDSHELASRKIAEILADKTTSNTAKADALLARLFAQEGARKKDTYTEFLYASAILDLPEIPDVKRIAAVTFRIQPTWGYSDELERVIRQSLGSLNEILARPDISQSTKVAALFARAMLQIWKEKLSDAEADYRTILELPGLPPALQTYARIWNIRIAQQQRSKKKGNSPAPKPKPDLRAEEQAAATLEALDTSICALDTPPEKRAESLFQRGVFYRDRRPVRSDESILSGNLDYALQLRDAGTTWGIAEFNVVAAMPGAPESLRAEAQRQAAALEAERAASDALTRAFFDSVNLEREALAERYPEGRKRAIQATAKEADEFYKNQMDRFGATKAEVVRWAKNEALASEGNPPKTLAALDALLSDSSLSPGLKREARLSRLKLFEKFGEPAKAIAEYKDILARNEAGGIFDSTLYQNCADFRAKAGDYAGAIADYSLLIDNDSSSTVPWYLLLRRAKLYEKAGDTAKAIADYAVVLKNFPDRETLLPMKTEAAARLARLQGKAENSGPQPPNSKPPAP